MEPIEHQRLKAVRRINKLDFENFPELEGIISIAKDVFDVPAVLINIIGKDKIWVKAKLGVSINHYRRDLSFCTHLLNEDDVLIIPDTLSDQRFGSNSSIIGDDIIRFYAGASLITSGGCKVGAVCLVDHAPREFSKKQQELLLKFSRQIIKLIESKLNAVIFKAQAEQIASSARKIKAVFDSSASCHIMIGSNMKVLDYNTKAALFLKQVEQKQIRKGADILQFISPSFHSEFLCSIKSAFAGKRIIKEVRMLHSQNLKLWWEITFFPVRNEKNDIISVCYKCSNITEKKLQNDKILTQNNLLDTIAYIQSHEYRKPVASILGLINIIRDEQYLPQKDNLMMMELAVNELDAKIRSVVKYAEDVIDPGVLILN